jgi:hypothetical protein
MRDTAANLKLQLDIAFPKYRSAYVPSRGPMVVVAPPPKPAPAPLVTRAEMDRRQKPPRKWSVSPDELVVSVHRCLVAASTGPSSGAPRKMTKDVPFAILALACEVMEITLTDLVGPCRDKKETRRRQTAMYFIFRNVVEGKREIGAAFNRDRTTVIHAIEQTVKRLEAEDEEVCDWLATLTERWESDAMTTEATLIPA